MNDILKKIPNVNELLSINEINIYPLDHFTKKNIIINVLDKYRNDILKGYINNLDLEILKQEIIITFQNSNFSLQKIYNATGVVLHTNLGRSIIPETAINNFININSGYSNIEYDIDNQKRGNRESHLKEILQQLTGCEDACIVNNNASAVYLVLNTFCKNKGVVISRGENVEIGGSFRIPEIIKASGAKILDVGTTNKTYLNDYEKAIDENKNANLLLKIHTSNYDIVGFQKATSISELANLKNEKIYLVEDQGSGTLIDISKYNSEIPKQNTVRQSLEDGADLVLFSGDKLLGSSQAGIIVGKKEMITQLKKNQIFRMLRTSKIITSILQSTLSLYLDEKNAIKNIPTLRMLCESKKEVENRVDQFLKLINNQEIVLNKIKTKAAVGGGSLPTTELESFGVTLKHKNLSDKKLFEKLCNLRVPIIGVINNKELILDFKTIQFTEIENLARIINDVK